MDWDEDELVNRNRSVHAMLSIHLSLTKAYLSITPRVDKLLSKIVLTDEEKKQVDELITMQEDYYSSLSNKYSDYHLKPSNN